MQLHLTRRRRVARVRLQMRAPLAEWACVGCSSDAVSIVEDRRGARGEGIVLLRCGECGLWRRVVMTGAIAARFRDHVRAGMAAMEDDVRCLRVEGADGHLAGLTSAASV